MDSFHFFGPNVPWLDRCALCKHRGGHCSASMNGDKHQVFNGTAESHSYINTLPKCTRSIDAATSFWGALEGLPPLPRRECVKRLQQVVGPDVCSFSSYHH